MRKLFIALSVILSVAGCASPGMSGSMGDAPASNTNVYDGATQ